MFPPVGFSSLDFVASPRWDGGVYYYYHHLARPQAGYMHSLEVNHVGIRCFSVTLSIMPFLLPLLPVVLF